MTTSDEEKFKIFENKILQKVYGPVQAYENGEWRLRNVVEIHDY